MGELAHLSVPDLKEAEGGLRDATVLKALVATWLVDVPHVDLERSRRALLDVRDVLHDVAGRATDRIAPELWGDLAARLGLRGRGVQPSGTSASSAAGSPTSRGSPGAGWTAVLARPASGARRRRPDAGPGRAGESRLSGGEVVLTPGRAAGRGPDPAAAGRGGRGRARRRARARHRGPAGRRGRTACRTRGRPRPGRPLVRLLAAGPGLLPVWETLEETGALGDVPARVGADPAAAARVGRSIGSPSTGTSSRPASRPPR